MAGRRFCVYFAWSRPQEIDVDLGVLENRYPALFEFRRALWPGFEHARAARQDISGFLDQVVRPDFADFGRLVEEQTGHAMSILQREEHGSPRRELDEDLLREVDTLIVVSLDHLRTGQQCSTEEIEAVRAFLRRENACLVVCPHHDVGASTDPGAAGMRRTPSVDILETEFRHHGDRLVPAQQRLGGFARSLLDALGTPVDNRFGLNPAAGPDGSPAALDVYRDLDELRVLDGVHTFNLHPHLPHLDVPAGLRHQVRVLAAQPINPRAAPHPFTQEGNRAFNAFVWIPPDGDRAGNVFVCDATLWSSAFGGLESLRSLWRNLARLRSA